MKSENSGAKFKWTAFIIISILIVLIKLTTFYPLWIEQKYYKHFYQSLSQFLRAVFGWIPISIGDILYIITGLFLVYHVIRFIQLILLRRLGSATLKNVLWKTFVTLAVIYGYFNLAWGLNYNRPGIAYQLNIEKVTTNEDDLRLVTAILLEKVNDSRRHLKESETALVKEEVFESAKLAYNAAADSFPFLNYRFSSVKGSLFGSLGDYLGFLGYFNPFTGEAQLNLSQPPFLLPFVTCHEMAHQLGYASESEASFVGYLVATHSSDPLFHYSAYFDLFNSANFELALRDSTAAKNNYDHLDTLVKIDQARLREYWKKSDNLIEPYISLFYDRYLKANQQEEGMKSYNRVVAWLIDYHKKYGKI